MVIVANGLANLFELFDLLWIIVEGQQVIAQLCQAIATKDNENIPRGNISKPIHSDRLLRSEHFHENPHGGQNEQNQTIRNASFHREVEIGTWIR